MSRAFLRQETLASNNTPVTTRLGLVSAPYAATEIGKFVKNGAESAHILCAAGDAIEGYIVAVESATANGFGIGTVQQRDTKFVTFDGLQATPGTGTVTIGSYVVCGTVVAKDTALTGYARVCKATTEPPAGPYAWRVVSLGSVGTGAVGTTGLIERI